MGIEKQITDKRLEIVNQQKNLSSKRNQLSLIDKEIQKASRIARTLPDGSDLLKRKDILTNEILTDIGIIKTLKSKLNGLIEGLNEQIEAKDLIGEMNEKIPVLLFPVRLETRFRKLDSGKYKLLVRILPDTISIQTHETNITEDEAADLDSYKKAVEGSNDHDVIIAAWKNLVDSYGPHRSAYLVNNCISDDQQEFKAESWTEAPKSYVMPDFFVIRLYRKTVNGASEEEEMLMEVPGSPITYPLHVGPDPQAIQDQTDANGPILDPESEWLVDFEQAKLKGMGLEIDLGSLDVDLIESGFSKLIAIGVRSTTKDESSKTLKDLINNHHFTEGFDFITQGTPTNNTSEEDSGFDSSEDNYEDSYQTEIAAQSIQNAEEDENLNGKRFCTLLGIMDEEIEAVTHARNTTGTEFHDIKCMSEVLWYSILDPYLRLMDKDIHNDNIALIRDHFINYVQARGPLSAIQVDNMPYGILPVSSLENWLEDKKIDHPEAFGLPELLKKLKKLWLEMTYDLEKVPRIGSSDDIDEEFIKILGMEGRSRQLRVRNIATVEYIRNLIWMTWSKLVPEARLAVFLKRLIINNFSNLFMKITPMFKSRNRSTNEEQRGQSSFEGWWNRFEAKVLQSNELLTELIGQIKEPRPIESTYPWGEGYDYKYPLVAESSESTATILGEVDNYLEKLTIEEEYNGKHSNTLLYILSKLSLNTVKDKYSNMGNFKQALLHLSKLKIIELEDLLMEVLDTVSFRLDTWITSLAHRRIALSRKEESSEAGIYLGAYGWVENLAPSPTPPSMGYVHAPSVTHAITASVLGNAYLSHASQENEERMRVNLSSDRVRKAKWILRGIREKQPLNTLLGYRFERNLHDTIHDNNGNTLFLDKYIMPFRKAYPIKHSQLEDNVNGESSETVVPRNVVNGMELLNAYKANNIPFNRNSELPDPGSTDHQVILKILDDLDETFDAVSDITLAESVHQAVLGNYLASGAILDAISGESSPPDDLTVCKTPRGGINVKHTFSIMFNQVEPDAIHNWPEQTPVSKLNPELNQWLDQMLGDPGDFKFSAEYIKTGELVKEIISLGDIINPQGLEENEFVKLSATDFLYMTALNPGNEESTFAQLIRYIIRKKRDLKFTTEISLDFECNTETDAKPLSNLITVANNLHTLITTASYLSPTDLMLPEEAEIGDEEDVLPARFGYLLSKLDDIVKTLRNDVLGETGSLTLIRQDLYEFSKQNNPSVDDCQTCKKNLISLVAYGMMDAIPVTAIETDETVQIILQETASSTATELKKKIKILESKLPADDWFQDIVKSSGSPDLKQDLLNQGISSLRDAYRSLYGKSFVFMPKFNVLNKSELLLASSSNAIDFGDQTPHTWMQQAAFTHKSVYQFENTMMLGKVNSGVDLNINVLQLPYLNGYRWVASKWPDEFTSEQKEAYQGSHSIAYYAPTGIDFNKSLCGLVIEKWDEMIPNTEETSSIAYHYDGPENEAPNICLLCVSPEINTENGKWKYSNLIKIVEETFDLQKIRMVDTDALKYLGRFLPGIYLRRKRVSGKTIEFALPMKQNIFN